MALGFPNNVRYDHQGYAVKGALSRWVGDMPAPVPVSEIKLNEISAAVIAAQQHHVFVDLAKSVGDVVGDLAARKIVLLDSKRRPFIITKRHNMNGACFVVKPREDPAS